MREKRQDGEELVIPLASEEVAVSKREVVRNRARINILTEEEQSLVRAELAREDVEIRHVEMNRLLEPGAPPPAPRVENGVTIIPVFEEVAVAVTRIRIKEEIHIIRHASREAAEIPVTLRTQRAVVERLNAGGDEMPAADPATPSEAKP